MAQAAPLSKWPGILAAGSAQIDLDDVDTGRAVRLVLPEHPARRWIEALVEADLEAILPELLDAESRAWMIRLIQDGGLEQGTHVRMVNQVVAMVAGMRWVTAVRLLSWTESNWPDFLGWCIGHGVGDPLELPLDRFCAVVWHVLFANQDDKGRRKLEFELNRPPVGADPDDEDSWAADEADTFMESMGNLHAFAAGKK